MGPSRLTWRWRVIARIVIVLVRLARWRVDVRGLERVPRSGGAVLAFNHHSYADFVMVAWPVVRRLRRPVRFLAKREIWASPRVGWVVRWAEAVPVDREDPERRHAAFDAAIEALSQGDLVAVAPEQTISPSFDLLPFKTGAVRMAQRAGVPIVPVIGFGTQRFATKGHPNRYATGIPVSVVFGEPIHVARDEDPVTATERLRATMSALLDDVATAYPDRPSPDDDWWYPSRLGGSAPAHDAVVAEHLERQRRRRERERGAPEEEQRDAS